VSSAGEEGGIGEDGGEGGGLRVEAFDIMLLSFSSSIEDKQPVSRRVEIMSCKLR
jgi:hypothetical protein